MKTILVTGNKSYIGTHFMPMLAAKYPDAIVSLCDMKDGQDYGDIKGQTFDVVVHLGALSTILGSQERADYLLDNNAFKLIPFLRDNKVGKLIFPSTGGAIYGEMTAPKKEEEAQWNGCLNPYSQSKYIAEKIIRHLAPNHTILRLGNVFGGDADARTEALVLTHFKHDDPIVLYGGNQTRDFVHVSIVCNAILNAIEKDVIGTFNIANGDPVSLGSLARMFSAQRGVPVVYKPANGIEIVSVTLDVTKARKEGLIPEKAPINDYSS